LGIPTRQIVYSPSLRPFTVAHKGKPDPTLFAGMIERRGAANLRIDAPFAPFTMPSIAVGISSTLSLPPDPFLMAVSQLNASCAFLTPIGHQCNAMILGPGGYRFGDYWKVGLPLEIVIVILGTPTILFFWPLS
jgi:hypothetical protein